MKNESYRLPGNYAGYDNYAHLINLPKIKMCRPLNDSCRTTRNTKETKLERAEF